MENKKNKNLGLALIAIFISILSIFISILKFNGTNQNNNYLLNGQQTHVTVEPIKHNAFNVSNDFDYLDISSTDNIITIYLHCYLSDNVYIQFGIFQLLEDPSITIETNLIIGGIQNQVYSYNISDIVALKFYNIFNYEFYISQVDNLEFSFNSATVSLNDYGSEQINNFDCPVEYYQEFLEILNNDFNSNLYASFYLDYFFNSSDYNVTLFDNISFIATKVGAILVATLSPITTLLFSNGKLTIVGASLAMALGVGAIYLIFRMVRALIKQNERG